MAIVWPLSLPVGPLASGYQEVLPDNTSRTSMDKGPAKVRRKGAALPVVFKVKMNLSKSERATLRTFLNSTTEQGSLRFEWTHPDTGATIECRFVPSSGGMIPFSGPSGEYQDATFTLEAMP